MEPEGSLRHSQVPATYPYPEPPQTSPSRPSQFLKIHFSDNLPSMPGYSKWSLSLQVFPPKPCMHLSSPPYVLHAPPISYLLCFITWTILGEQYRSISSSSCSFLLSPVTSSLLGPNIPLSIQFLNAHSLCSCCSVSDQVSHPHKTTGTIVLYILIFYIFL